MPAVTPADECIRPSWSRTTRRHRSEESRVAGELNVRPQRALPRRQRVIRAAHPRWCWIATPLRLDVGTLTLRPVPGTRWTPAGTPADECISPSWSWTTSRPRLAARATTGQLNVRPHRALPRRQRVIRAAHPRWCWIATPLRLDVGTLTLRPVPGTR